jgi:polysaccharide pyruvyl transferase WcaK-like protein
MRILMEQSGHALKNLGDWAMLRVAVQRCRDVFPGCRIQVVGEDATRIRECIPEAEPITTAAREMVLSPPGILGGSTALGRRTNKMLVRHMPAVGLPIARAGHRRRGADTASFDQFVESLQSADLVLASGGGYITDAFPMMVESVGGVLGLAQQYKKPTAMMGQGLGPLNQPWLIAEARRSMRRLVKLGLREGVSSPAIAQLLNVPADRVTVTGDDAVELAYGQRTEELGTRLGINVRTAWYSKVQSDEVGALRDAISSLLKRFNTMPRMVPISFYEDEDRVSTRALLGDAAPTDEPSIDSPDDAIHAAGECRLVITGSYHAGVFALSQGVPVVALAKSAYYVDKFRGLAGQFGPGCLIVRMDQPEMIRELTTKADDLWQNAARYRPELLERAVQQIAAGRSAYASLAEVAA